MNWMDMSLHEFQQALASSQPTPGGGTAAAIALGQSSALIRMVSGLTLGNEKWKDGWRAASDAEAIVDSIFTRSGELAKLDSDAFDQVMNAYRMPKGSDDEKSLRLNQIRNSTLHAAEIPYQTVKLGMDLLSCMELLAKNGNANAVSDVGVASLLATAAVKGALFNVEINLQSLPAEMGDDLRKLCSDVKSHCSQMSRGIMQAVHERIDS